MIAATETAYQTESIGADRKSFSTVPAPLGLHFVIPHHLPPAVTFQIPKTIFLEPLLADGDQLVLVFLALGALENTVRTIAVWTLLLTRAVVIHRDSPSYLFLGAAYMIHKSNKKSSGAAIDSFTAYNFHARMLKT